MANRDDELASLHGELVGMAKRTRAVGREALAVALDAAATALYQDLDEATAAELMERLTGERPPDA